LSEIFPNIRNIFGIQHISLFFRGGGNAGTTSAIGAGRGKMPSFEEKDSGGISKI